MYLKPGLVLFLGVFILSCQSQQKESRAESPLATASLCEGCAAVFEYGGRTLSHVDTLPKFQESTPKIRLSGKVLKPDGSPARGVILYIYHTNRSGIYERAGNEEGWGQRHGFIRGWVKTNAAGEYTFYTFRPAAYPNASIPEHIHVIVKEEGKDPYYIEDFLFDDDPYLTSGNLQRLTQQGGSGVISLQKEGELLVANRTILLGLNIPNYPR